MLHEVKIYIFLISLSCLLLVVREKVPVSILTTYFLASIFGVKTIGCFITGKCYYEVYYFLIGYALMNILFVFYYHEMKKFFSSEDNQKNKDNRKNKNSLYQDIKNNVIKLNKSLSKKFNRGGIYN
jgi:energy-coupling factor transporter transmembrane protein EcfT